MTPAMAAGVTDRLWEMSDVVDLLEAFDASRKRADYPCQFRKIFYILGQA
jgi:hypothetical protein